MQLKQIGLLQSIVKSGCRHLLLIVLGGLLFVSAAQAETGSVETAWRLLDYIAVDYREAVQDGEIVSPSEYKEMVEFAASARARIDSLPESEAKVRLQQEAASLEKAIAQKEKPDEVAQSARTIAAALLASYPFPAAPNAPPNLGLGKTLYTKHCASCHGTTGDGQGAAGRGLDPPPIAFLDRERAQERSVLGLYQVIEQGIDGTGMTSYRDLPEQERWALAFYVSTFAYTSDDVAKGQRVWKANPKLQENLDLRSLVAIRPGTWLVDLPQSQMDDLTAYLRHNPSVVVRSSTASLAFARTRLADALTAYSEGKTKVATDLALSAYLDGFEPVEALLSINDKDLVRRIEDAMGQLRSGIASRQSVSILRSHVTTLESLFAEAERALSQRANSGWTSFLGVFAVLLREGLEALLIVVGMTTFLRKAEREDMLSYVHGGWIAALAAGVVTWIGANWFVSISGVTRELTEGLASMFSAMILLWVGVWMHGKSQANAWQSYIREKLSRALDSRSAWFLFGLSFLVVYREVFETILFCVAIWNQQGSAPAMLAGAVVAGLALWGTAWALVRYSRALPIRQFFAYSSALLAVLAVILSGKGISALQEAGFLSVNPLMGFPRIELLGMAPTVECATGQFLMLVLLALGFGYNWRYAEKEA